jgi:uncharacterized membrane protein
MTDARGPSTRRLLALAVLAGVALLATLARILAGDPSPWVLSQAAAFGLVLAILGQRLWVRRNR